MARPSGLCYTDATKGGSMRVLIVLCLMATPAFAEVYNTPAPWPGEAPATSFIWRGKPAPQIDYPPCTTQCLNPGPAVPSVDHEWKLLKERLPFRCKTLRCRDA